MKKLWIASFAFLCAIFLANVVVGAEDAALQTLQGKWEVKKTGPEGQKYTQTIEIKKDKFIFKIVDADKEVRLYAEGNLKSEKLGPFMVLKFTDIKAGASASDLSDINDDRVSIYQLRDGSLHLVGNMDKERDNNGPSLDVYKRMDK